MFDTSYTHGTATITSCESEQLHLSGRIQGHGALLAVSACSRRVTYASANCETALGLPAAALLGALLSELPLYIGEFDGAYTLAEKSQLTVANVLLAYGGQWDVTLTRVGDMVLLEWEQSTPDVMPIAIHQMHRTLVRPPSRKDDIADYYNMLVGYFRRITGMDRVMIYRFREDWSGEVLAEGVTGDHGSYMGVRFPAGDIPQIARTLYLQNPYRMIPDEDGEVFPVWGLTAEPPDLTWSDLRSVSPMHLAYMRNMGVRASFSVPIVIMGKLWGLVACHHYQGPHLLSQVQRHACVTLGAAFSLGLASFQAGMHLQTLDSMDRRIQSALQAFAGLDNPLEGMCNTDMPVTALIRADGFALAIDEQAAISGLGPDLDGLSIIDDWFLSHCEDAYIAIDRMSEVFPDSFESLKPCCGVLAIKVWTVSRGWLRFYWFRQEEAQEIAWAGNPDKPQAENTAASALSPRRSFEKWVEIRTGHCREWTTDEKLMAAKFRSTAGRLL